MNIEYAFSSVIDEGLANLTKALKMKGMWESTLLVVTSDNGGPAFTSQAAASNFPLRGAKHTYFEGGIRVNAFVSGGILPVDMRGKNITSTIHICDWYATFCGLAGVDPSDDRDGVPPIDSINQWRVISGATATALRRETFVGSGVLIQDNFKLVATNPGNAQWSGPLHPKVPPTGPKSLSCSIKVPCLFDVEVDPSERNDLAGMHPEVAANLTARLKVLMMGVFESTKPNVTKEQVCNATAQNGGYLTPADWAPPAIVDRALLV